jgi:hypothetical protein
MSRAATGPIISSLFQKPWQKNDPRKTGIKMIMIPQSRMKDRNMGLCIIEEIHKADKPQPKGNRQRIETTQLIKASSVGLFLSVGKIFAFKAMISLFRVYCKATRKS